MTNIFVSYSRKDALWVQEGEYGLIPWLKRSLKRKGVDLWHDHALKDLPGEDYKRRIDEEISRSQMAILLISQEFLNSDFIREFEIPAIKARLDIGELKIVPILVGHTVWDLEVELRWIADRQMLPGTAAPLVDYIGDPARWQAVQAEILRAILNRLPGSDAQEKPEKHLMESVNSAIMTSDAPLETEPSSFQAQAEIDERGSQRPPISQPAPTEPTSLAPTPPIPSRQRFISAVVGGILAAAWGIFWLIIDVHNTWRQDLDFGFALYILSIVGGCGAIAGGVTVARRPLIAATLVGAVLGWLISALTLSTYPYNAGMFGAPIGAVVGAIASEQARQHLNWP